MSARPILFSGSMIRALIEGRKTQTRRVVKLPKWAVPDSLQLNESGAQAVGFPSGSLSDVPCPYGKSGDLLWVRETFQPLFADGWEEGRNPDGSGDRANYKTGEGYAPHYVADCGRIEFVTPDGDLVTRCTPPIRMPRWASRLTLRITDVRVERLNDISEADAIAEGIGTDDVDAAVACYGALWDRINGPGSWNANPWVWALTFDTVQRNVDDVLLELANAEVKP